MTRAEMRRTAMALAEIAASKRLWSSRGVANMCRILGVNEEEVVGLNDRIRWTWENIDCSGIAESEGCWVEASLLMSEACAPEWEIAP